MFIFCNHFYHFLSSVKIQNSYNHCLKNYIISKFYSYDNFFFKKAFL